VRRAAVAVYALLTLSGKLRIVRGCSGFAFGCGVGSVLELKKFVWIREFKRFVLLLVGWFAFASFFVLPVRRYC
jgi:hypothetical protein